MLQRAGWEGRINPEQARSCEDSGHAESKAGYEGENVFSSHWRGEFKWRCDIKLSQVGVDDFCQSRWGKFTQAPDFTERVMLSKQGGKQKKISVAQVSKMTKESAICQGYTSPHGALWILQSLPVSSKGLPSWGSAHSSVDSEPHTCPQPASLGRVPTWTPVHNSPASDVPGHSGQHLSSPPATFLQPSLTIHHHTPAAPRPLSLSHCPTLSKPPNSSPHPSRLLRKKFIHPSFPLFDMLLRKPSAIFLASPFLKTIPGTLYMVVRIIPDESWGLLISPGVSLPVSRSVIFLSSITSLSCPREFHFLAPLGLLVDFCCSLCRMRSLKSDKSGGKGGRCGCLHSAVVWLCLTVFCQNHRMAALLLPKWSWDLERASAVCHITASLLPIGTSHFLPQLSQLSTALFATTAGTPWQGLHDVRPPPPALLLPRARLPVTNCQRYWCPPRGCHLPSMPTP